MAKHGSINGLDGMERIHLTTKSDSITEKESVKSMSNCEDQESVFSDDEKHDTETQENSGNQSSNPSEVPDDQSVSKAQDTKTRSQTKSNQRFIQQKWFEQYTWLELDQERWKFVCTWCRDTDTPSQFAVCGKNANNCQKVSFDRHEKSAAHQRASALVTGQPGSDSMMRVSKRDLLEACTKGRYDLVNT